MLNPEQGRPRLTARLLAVIDSPTRCPLASGAPQEDGQHRSGRVTQALVAEQHGQAKAEHFIVGPNTVELKEPGSGQ